ncbi:MULTISPECIES: hypothetical protein [Dyella]|uniref:Uncharacterized protein n=2 Tax=Dyella TaxID=231454 RepID=A0A4R0YE35_9GAMM|nr:MULTISPECIES: hypothetical protein [Dyella]TBR36184.1 hypothetical protein EYV96_16465 [Dyella terrae]TCI06233.1 hypothetical protein EZM97_35555 [Dyella soli]
MPHPSNSASQNINVVPAAIRASGAGSLDPADLPIAHICNSAGWHLPEPSGMAMEWQPLAGPAPVNSGADATGDANAEVEWMDASESGSWMTDSQDPLLSSLASSYSTTNPSEVAFRAELAAAHRPVLGRGWTGIERYDPNTRDLLESSLDEAFIATQASMRNIRIRQEDTVKLVASICDTRDPVQIERACDTFVVILDKVLRGLSHLHHNDDLIALVDPDDEDSMAEVYTHDPMRRTFFFDSARFLSLDCADDEYRAQLVRVMRIDMARTFIHEEIHKIFGLGDLSYLTYLTDDMVPGAPLPEIPAHFAKVRRELVNSPSRRRSLLRESGYRKDSMSGLPEENRKDRKRWQRMANAVFRATGQLFPRNADQNRPSMGHAMEENELAAAAFHFYIPDVMATFVALTSGMEVDAYAGTMPNWYPPLQEVGTHRQQQKSNWADVADTYLGVKAIGVSMPSAGRTGAQSPSPSEVSQGSGKGEMMDERIHRCLERLNEGLHVLPMTGDHVPEYMIAIAREMRPELLRRVAESDEVKVTYLTGELAMLEIHANGSIEEVQISYRLDAPVVAKPKELPPASRVAERSRSHQKLHRSIDARAVAPRMPQTVATRAKDPAADVRMEQHLSDPMERARDALSLRAAVSPSAADRHAGSLMGESRERIRRMGAKLVALGDYRTPGLPRKLGHILSELSQVEGWPMAHQAELFMEPAVLPTFAELMWAYPRNSEPLAIVPMSHALKVLSLHLATSAGQDKPGLALDILDRLIPAEKVKDKGKDKDSTMASSPSQAAGSKGLSAASLIAGMHRSLHGSGVAIQFVELLERAVSHLDPGKHREVAKRLKGNGERAVAPWSDKMSVRDRFKEDVYGISTQGAPEKVISDHLIDRVRRIIRPGASPAGKPSPRDVRAALEKLTPSTPLAVAVQHARRLTEIDPEVPSESALILASNRARIASESRAKHERRKAEFKANLRDSIAAEAGAYQRSLARGKIDEEERQARLSQAYHQRMASYRSGRVAQAEQQRIAGHASHAKTTAMNDAKRDSARSALMRAPGKVSNRGTRVPPLGCASEGRLPISTSTLASRHMPAPPGAMAQISPEDLERRFNDLRRLNAHEPGESAKDMEMRSARLAAYWMQQGVREAREIERRHRALRGGPSPT